MTIGNKLDDKIDWKKLISAGNWNKSPGGSIDDYRRVLEEFRDKGILSLKKKGNYTLMPVADELFDYYFTKKKYALEYLNALDLDDCYLKHYSAARFVTNELTRKHLKAQSSS
jgi:hypothetical protein